jgi:Tol biopolymer transport system component
MLVQGGGLRIPVDIDKPSGHPYFRGLAQWSPQGDILAFAYASKSRTIMDTVRLVHVENGRFDKYEEIKAKALSLQWSPDGSKLLIAGSDLQVYDLAAKSTKKLRYPEKSPSSIRPTWSFDGRKIAFIGANGSRLYVMNTSDESVSEIPLATNTNGLSSSQSIYHVFWVP